MPLYFGAAPSQFGYMHALQLALLSLPRLQAN